MAGDINRVTLVGRLTRDPELRHLPSGSPVLQLGLAVGRALAHQIRKAARKSSLCANLGFKAGSGTSPPAGT